MLKKLLGNLKSDQCISSCSTSMHLILILTNNCFIRVMLSNFHGSKIHIKFIIDWQLFIIVLNSLVEQPAKDFALALSSYLFIYLITDFLELEKFPRNLNKYYRDIG